MFLFRRKLRAERPRPAALPLPPDFHPGLSDAAPAPASAAPRRRRQRHVGYTTATYATRPRRPGSGVRQTMFRIV
ncbi:hypothetical protein [Cognatiluteimonas weifangensis]|uniref:hypothetical protein n=1 Tax=Cognatiluteimonas weifangensis TaxID=2303539 RepID=UPI0011C113D0|nr:hypothetical protein [Luteimonas weifangensis]